MFPHLFEFAGLWPELDIINCSANVLSLVCVGGARSAPSSPAHHRPSVHVYSAHSPRGGERGGMGEYSDKTLTKKRFLSNKNLKKKIIFFPNLREAFKKGNKF